MRTSSKASIVAKKREKPNAQDKAMINDNIRPAAAPSRRWE